MSTKYIVTFLYAPSGKQNGIEDVNKMVNRLVGVKRVANNKYVKSIMDIEYDPRVVTSSFIVKHIKQQGAQGALIAM